MVGLTWLLRELRAQARRAGLLVAVTSAGLVAASALLPTVDAAFLSNPNTVEGGIRSALIQNDLGWLVFVTALAILATVAVAVTRRARLAPALLLVALGLGVMGMAESLARGEVLDPCNARATVQVRGDIACAQLDEWLLPHPRFAPGLAFDVMALGGAGAAVGGLLVAVNGQSRRRPRRILAGRDDVVWL